MNDIIRHYDTLIDENNDPVHDPKQLRDYMDKWDGQAFIDEMRLDTDKSVLEIGVGTGRLAVRVAPLCGHFVGIDISSKTIERAKENLKEHANVNLISGNFLTYDFGSRKFDVIYSSLTFMHIKKKQYAIDKIASFLAENGRFVQSSFENRKDVYLTISGVPTTYTDDEILFATQEIKIGKQLHMKSKNYVGHGYIISVNDGK